MTIPTTANTPPSRARALLVLIAALLPVLGLLVAAPAATALPKDPQITFCHASSSVKNPYQTTTTDADSIFKQGHDGHIGPAWSASMVQGDAWGDIIPAFDYVDAAGSTVHYPGLNAELADVIAHDCSPVHATATAPAKTDETCTAVGTITIPSVQGVLWALDSVSASPGTYDVAAGSHTVTAAPVPGYVLDGQTTWTVTVAAHGSCATTVTAVDPTVVQSPRCGVEGSYTIPETTGITYLIEGDVVAAGTHSGPATGTITALAEDGYALSSPSWSFALDVPAAEACPVVVVAVPEDPTVTQSSACGVEGSYTIPATTGITYLLDGTPIAAGTYSGPVTATVSAKAAEGYTLTEPDWSFDLAVAGAAECPLPETGGTLPQTGGSTAPLAGVAALLLAMGTGIVVAATRRPTSR
ncbi:MAG TPA: hypothetical protein VFL59_14645 [Candidatus Nanopelagicales bacterium]|nr:hypothetical protein [Candidatus Nanopelagicales bacterium]